MKAITLIFTWVLCSAIYAQSEIIVNTYQDSTQNQPIIQTLDDQDNFAVLWKSFNQAGENSEGDIYLKFFSSDLSPLSDDLLVNDLFSGPQETPAMASDINGKLAVVWSSFDRTDAKNFFDIKGKIFQDMSAETFEFTVNSYTEGSQLRPDIAMNKNGGFLVVWESWFQDGSDRGVYAQLFDADGNKTGEEFLVNSATEFSQCRPAVEFFDNGNFIVVWESWDQSEIGYNLFAKIFDSAGNVITDEFMVNTYTDNYQWMADIAVYEDNSFDIVWCSWEQDGYDGGIYLRSFKSDFAAMGEEVQINSSTEFYQWLPKIKKYDDSRKTVIWSSWNLDGSREGIYFKTLSKTNKELSLEKRINENTESFQWEPDFAVQSSGDIISTWSSWGEVGKDYEIMLKKLKPEFLIGKLNENSYLHPYGRSTSNFIVHVIDSTELNGHEYEITFQDYNDKFLSFNVTDLTAAESKVNDFPLDQGINVQYLTEEFDGVIVEIIPNFELDIDFENSRFINNSGTNVDFSIAKPVIYPSIAPLDVAVIWGSPDTLTDGRFTDPLDTALSPSNVREIELPFYAVTIGENEKLGTVVFENPSTQNKRWDPGENIVFLTPEGYGTNVFSTHAQLFSTLISEDIIWPNIGDTNIISVLKPITKEDVYRFSTFSKDIILDFKSGKTPAHFSLSQNYPNPFNPITVIEYSINEGISPLKGVPSSQSVKLDIYDLLGRKVSTLVDKKQTPGKYTVSFNGSKYSSGIYFYRLETENAKIVKKMILMK
jgi:hypothetical protein